MTSIEAIEEHYGYYRTRTIIPRKPKDSICERFMVAHAISYYNSIVEHYAKVHARVDIKSPRRKRLTRDIIRSAYVARIIECAKRNENPGKVHSRFTNRRTLCRRHKGHAKMEISVEGESMSNNVKNSSSEISVCPSVLE